VWEHNVAYGEQASAPDGLQPPVTGSVMLSKRLMDGKMSQIRSNDTKYSRLALPLFLYCMILLLCSCTGPSVSYRQYITEYEPKTPGTPIAIYAEYEKVQGEYKIIGVVSIGDTGLSINCDWPEVLEIAKEKARNAGGDAIQITNVRSPDISSTCYRITANILKVGTPQRKGETSTGTGFSISSNGTIVTAFHIVERATKIEVKFPNKKWLPARLIRHSRSSDIAILQVDTTLSAFLDLRSTKNLKPGDTVFTMGYPVVELLGTEAKYTDGKISSLTGIKGEDSLMQITVPIQPGNSGGPLVTSDGYVVGLVTSTAAVKYFFAITETLPQNINWAVKADYITPMLHKEALDHAGIEMDDPVKVVSESICIVKAE